MPPVINFRTSNTSCWQALNFLYPLLGDWLFLGSAVIIFEVGAWLLNSGAAQLLPSHPLPRLSSSAAFLLVHERSACLPAIDFRHLGVLRLNAGDIHLK